MFIMNNISVNKRLASSKISNSKYSCFCYRNVVVVFIESVFIFSIKCHRL